MTNIDIGSSSSRRQFMAAGAALALASALPSRAAFRQPAATPDSPSAAAPPANFFDWPEVAPNVRVALSPRGVATLGGSSTLLLGQSATLIDTKYPVLAAALRRESSSFGKPLATVINTHHHADHTGGNLAFTPDLPVLAHPKAIERVHGLLKRYVDGIPGMTTTLTAINSDASKPIAAEAQELSKHAADLKIEQFLPTRPIDLDTDLDLGGFKARATHPGPAHTDNDIAIHLPDANILITGDLVFHYLHPVLDRASGGTSAGWIAALGTLIPLCDDKTIVIPGHGNPGPRDLLTTQAAYLQALRDLMASAVKVGKERTEALKTPIPASFKDYHSPERFPLTLGAIYDDVAAEAAAAATPPK